MNNKDITKRLCQLTLKDRSLEPVIICGPSGVGKTTLIKYLTDTHPNKYSQSVSHTTRKPRKEEKNGKDYHFVENDVFNKMKDKGEFLEHIKFGDNQYGTSLQSFEQVNESGKIWLANFGRDAVDNMKSKKKFKDARYIVVTTSKLDDLKGRLTSRGDNQSDIDNRSHELQKDFEFSQKEDYFDCVIVNDNGAINQAKMQLEKFLGLGNNGNDHER